MMKKSCIKMLGAALGLILAFTLTSTAAFAQHAAKGDNGVNGQQVAVDKQSGKLRSLSADEAKVLLDGLAPLLNQSSEGLTVVKHEDGTLSVDLQDRFMSVAVAKVTADGTVEQGCVTNLDEAKEFLQGEKKESKPKAEVKQPVLEEK